jgi:hypothetical protein
MSYASALWRFCMASFLFIGDSTGILFSTVFLNGSRFSS